MPGRLPLLLVLLSGLYFLVLGAAALIAPAHASRFLLGFATSARAHFLELVLRGLVGGAFVLQAPAMRYSSIVYGFGWVLVATTAALLLLPWRWHRDFAQRAVPRATRFLIPIGLCSLIMGGVVWHAALAP
ncbi:MAG: hypothetical protein H0W15_00185 [Gemmatimonadales bacterium]|nr:hypothetical protein [Gemmatimonadales bacterium]